MTELVPTPGCQLCGDEACGYCKADHMTKEHPVNSQHDAHVMAYMSRKARELEEAEHQAKLKVLAALEGLNSDSASRVLGAAAVLLGASASWSPKRSRGVAGSAWIALERRRRLDVDMT